MSASDLESWLKEDSSEFAGWSKDDGSGETVGHERYVPTVKYIMISKSRRWSQ